MHLIFLNPNLLFCKLDSLKHRETSLLLYSAILHFDVDGLFSLLRKIWSERDQVCFLNISDEGLVEVGNLIEIKLFYDLNDPGCP